MALGNHLISYDDLSAVAENLYRRGARLVKFLNPIDPESPHGALQTCLLRDLTAWGILVEWTALTREDASLWPMLGHLVPPGQIVGSTNESVIVETWRAEFFLCRCIYRRGIGFVEVRDRRFGDLRRYTIDDPLFIETIAALEYCADVNDLDEDIVDQLAAENLVFTSGDRKWWLPYRVRKWPQPALAV
ncbi:DUF5825 family protein [Streptomyces sp. NPDC005574]|uniref:DUF5825 family protein n=1 Tax=Streptomyces sp. NPDC005574 TaxID=3156891 RepID=UPI0033A9D811